MINYNLSDILYEFLCYFMYFFLQNLHLDFNFLLCKNIIIQSSEKIEKYIIL